MTREEWIKAIRERIRIGGNFQWLAGYCHGVADAGGITQRDAEELIDKARN